MGINHLSHFALTLRLLPLLRKSAASSPLGARIVNVTSFMHILSRIRAADPMLRSSKYTSQTAYSNSKNAQILFTRALRKHLEGTGVHAFAVHPGEVLTNIARHIPQWLFKLQQLTLPLVLLTPREGGQLCLLPILNTTVTCVQEHASALRRWPPRAGVCRLTRRLRRLHSPNLCGPGRGRCHISVSQLFVLPATNHAEACLLCPAKKFVVMSATNHAAACLLCPAYVW